MDETLTRILELMQKKRITEAEIQVLIGVPRGSFSNWKRNKGQSYYRYLDTIADRLGVTLDYLMRGHETVDGSMTKEEIELLTDYRRLPQEGKRVIADNIRLIVGRNDCSQKFKEREDVG